MKTATNARSCALAIGLGLALLASGCKDNNTKKGPKAGSGSAKKGSAAGFSGYLEKPLKNAAPSFNILAKPAFAQVAKGPKSVSISDIAERAVKSVVNVRTTRQLPRPTWGGGWGGGSPFGGGGPPGYNPYGPHGGGGGGMNPFGPPRGYQRRRPRRRQAPGARGSGVIVTTDGVVLTNHHVIKRASKIRVTLSDGREFEAKIVGSDPKSDLAVLRIQGNPKNLEALPFGNSSALRLGEVVLAIGNPFGVGQTVTMGIVSAKGRAKVGIVEYEDFIQTDAAINPGNSGGALVNMRGELIGINTAILSKSGGNQGIGFAIPSKMGKPILQSLLKHGRVIRGWLGVAIQELTKDMAQALKLPTHRGVLVTAVQPGSPAEKAGLERADVIVKLDGQAVKSVSHLRNEIAIKGDKAKVKLTLLRKGKSKDIEATLGVLPGSAPTPVAKPSALGGLTVEKLAAQTRRQLGLPGGATGVIVTKVDPGSPAAAAGIRAGDLIGEVNRKAIASPSDFSREFAAAKRKVLMLVFRQGSALYVLLEK
ncbi:MAG: Do family serine endopeptidase [Myxococcales bacterium]|nr:Do family serine endopeptidase [Myxococcales bacterium]